MKLLDPVNELGLELGQVRRFNEHRRGGRAAIAGNQLAPVRRTADRSPGARVLSGETLGRAVIWLRLFGSRVGRLLGKPPVPLSPARRHSGIPCVKILGPCSCLRHFNTVVKRSRSLLVIFALF